MASASVGNFLTLAKDFAGVGALVGAVFVAAGFSISPPWPTHQDFDTLKSDGARARVTIEAVQRQQAAQIRMSRRQYCIILQLLKDRYQKEQDDAQSELNRNITSPTLQRARDEAKGNVENIDSEQRVDRCLQAPGTSSSEPDQTAQP